MDLLGRLAGMPDADERFQKQVAYATSAWSGLMDNMIYKAAGNELLRAIKDATPEKPVDENVMREIGLKYHLTPERMDQLGSMLVKSGALPIALKEQQRRMRDEQLLAEASAQTGLPSESAARVKEKAITSTLEPQAEAKAPQTRKIERDGFVVTEEWDAANGAWKEIARSPKWNPKTGTGGGGTGGGAKASPEKAPSASGGKILPAGKVQELSNKAQIISQYESLSKSFDPSYAGAIVGGPAATKIYERTGIKGERVNWWKQFKMMDAKLRNDLFGASLTANEQAAWDSVTVSENSDPETIRTALNTRKKIAQQALSREKEGYKTMGYNVGNAPSSKFKIIRVE